MFPIRRSPTSALAPIAMAFSLAFMAVPPRICHAGSYVPTSEDYVFYNVLTVESSLDLAIATTLANNGPYDPNGLFQYSGQFNQATDPSGSLSGGFSGSLTGTYLGMDAAANYTGILMGDPEYTLSGDMKVPGLGDGDFTGNINDNGNGADVGVQIETKNGGTYKGSVKGATRIRDKIGHKTIYEGDMSIGGYTETFRFVVNDIKAGDATGTVSGSIVSEINGNTINSRSRTGSGPTWALPAADPRPGQFRDRHERPRALEPRDGSHRCIDVGRTRYRRRRMHRPSPIRAVSRAMGAPSKEEESTGDVPISAPFRWNGGADARCRPRAAAPRELEPA